MTLLLPETAKALKHKHTLAEKEKLYLLDLLSGIIKERDLNLEAEIYQKLGAEWV